MKKRIIYIAAAFILVLSGCSEAKNNTAEAQDNNGETLDISTSGSAETSNSAALGSETDDNADGDMIEIKENLFIAQTNDVYINTEEYLGKTIKYEGIFNSYLSEETNESYCYVIRYGPGCCGYDSNAGFEVIWDGDYPEQDDWVEVVGVLEMYEENDYQYLRLRLTSLTVLKVRGEEYVGA